MPSLPDVKWTKSLEAFGTPDGPPHEGQLRNIAMMVNRLGWSASEGHDYVFSWVFARLGYEMLSDGQVSYASLHTALDAQRVYALLEHLREQQVVAARQAKARAL
jgi:hypothetical protein